MISSKKYEKVIYTYLSSNDKIKFQKIANKHGKSVSELSRQLIKIIIQFDKLGFMNEKLQKEEKKLANIFAMATNSRKVD